MTTTNENDGGPREVTVPQAQSAEVVRDGFQGQEVERRPETASTALATQARAQVEARYVMALKRPRNIEGVRLKLLDACKRPTFAGGSIYKKPVGMELNEETNKWEQKFVEGLNIRFAEEACRLMGNLMSETVAIYDDPRKRIIRVSTTDLETNVTYYKDLNVEKTTERRKLKKNQKALSSRVNSYGDVTYLVEATEDDVAKKEGGLASKALRDNILRLVPGDIKEECERQIRLTQKTADAKDPEAAKRAVLDSFYSVGVSPEQIVEYLDHPLEQLLPSELQHLRAIYSAIRDGEARWADVLEDKRDFDEEFRKKEEAKKKEAEKKAAGTNGKPTDLKDVAAATAAQREPAAADGPAQQTLDTKKSK